MKRNRPTMASMNGVRKKLDSVRSAAALIVISHAPAAGTGLSDDLFEERLLGLPRSRSSSLSIKRCARTGHCQCLYVIGEHIVPLAERRQRLTGRMRLREPLGLAPSRKEGLRRVALTMLVMYSFTGLDTRIRLRAFCNSAICSGVATGSNSRSGTPSLGLQDCYFLLLFRITQPYAQQEPVKLRFGQRECSLESIGFCVAMTKNGWGRLYVFPSTVTCRSSMLSRRLDCVLGMVRFISSARSTWVMTGPAWNVKCPVC